MSDIRYACTTADLPTGTGVFEVTISGLGWTPKAVMITVTTRENDASPGADANLSVGCVVKDGSSTGNEWAVAMTDNDGVGTQAGHRIGATNECVQIMKDNHIRHLPVMDEGRLIGIVSIGDVVKNRLEDMGMEANLLRDIAIARR